VFLATTFKMYGETMEKLRAKHLHSDICSLYQQEIKALYGELEAVQLEKNDLKLHYKDLISAERKEKEALLLEIQELKKAGGVNKHQVSGVQVLELKRKHEAEMQMLAIEFNIELKDAKQELENLHKELQKEKELKAQSEAGKLEAVEIADALMESLENFQKVSEEHPAAVRSDESHRDTLHLDIHQPLQMLHRERRLRDRAEAESLNQFNLVEAFCEESEQELQREKQLRAAAERSKLARRKTSCHIGGRAD